LAGSSTRSVACCAHDPSQSGLGLELKRADAGPYKVAG
jgi:hypothetical protein